MTPSPSETPYKSYYEGLAIAGFIPVPDGSAEANKYTGIVGAVVGVMAVALTGTLITKAYKKKQLLKEPKKYKKTPNRPSRDEEAPFTPYTSQPATPNPRISISLPQTSSTMPNPLKHLQVMETYRTSHGPVQASHNSNRRLPVVLVTNPTLSVNKTGSSPPANTYYSSVRTTILPKANRPIPNRIKGIQFQQQQRMLRLAKEEDIEVVDE